jgi:cysteine-rich repeat protein
MSLETCGNAIVDIAGHESCDEGDALDHDGCSSSCQFETPRWFERRTNVTGRSAAAMAYDPARDRVVLFGGFEIYSTLADTWEWDGGSWSKVSGPSPTARFGAAMAFDGRGVLLHGGSGQGDTWRFDGAVWTQVAASGPAGRTNHAMAYDSRRKRVVLFGGSPLGGSNAFDDTWEWDGTSWTVVNVLVHPPGRIDALMTYDPVHGVVVLAGGSGIGTPCSSDAACADTWTFDGVTWTYKTPSGVVPHNSHFEMAFDPGTQRVLAIGGTGIDVQTVFAWDGSSWIDLSPASSPAPAPESAAAGTRAGLVLVTTGGQETWIWKANAWSKAGTPGSVQLAAFVNDRARDVALLLTGGVTWELSRTGWRQLAASSPPQRSQAAIAYDPLAKRVVLFGGNDASATTRSDTWIWNGESWAQPTPALSPAGRQGAAIAFDGTHVTMFGGVTSTTFGAPANAETWSWNGTTWAATTSVTSPPAMTGAAAGYDPIRDEMVLFGMGETWTYDGTSWTKKPVVVAPPARTYVPLVWNAARQRLVLGGGEGSIDVWEWNGDEWAALATSARPPARVSASYAEALDGQGVIVYGGIGGMNFFKDLWELRFDGDRLPDRCDGRDADDDSLVGCADDDCWTSCTPACPPGTSCPAGAPRCGDGACDAVFETCQTCAVDCTCNAVCGDLACAPGEVCPGDCP